MILSPSFVDGHSNDRPKRLGNHHGAALVFLQGLVENFNYVSSCELASVHVVIFDA